jgi:uncharacterized protein YjbI with pentapeptide repeats
MTADPELFARLRTLDPAGRRTVLANLPTPLALGLCPDAGKAVLDGADLSAGSGIDLRKADLRGASLRGCDLTGANLEEADLTGADLAGARLPAANLGGAKLAGSQFEDADLRGAKLRFAAGGRAVFDGAALTGADLWGAKFAAAAFSRADLTAATLSEGVFADAELDGADLRGATLFGADLSGAVLREARLDGVSLQGCKLHGAFFADCWLDRSRLAAEQVGEVIGEEAAGRFADARRGYLALERNFETLGDPDAASWAYRRKRRMEKWSYRHLAAAEWSAGRRVAAIRAGVRFANLQFVEWLCDYGEGIPRTLASIGVLFLFFVAFYGVTGTVLRDKQVTRSPLDLATFSLLTMAQLDTGQAGLEPANKFAYLLSGVEALMTIFLTGLVGFVVGNRIRR